MLVGAFSPSLHRFSPAPHRFSPSTYTHVNVCVAVCVRKYGWLDCVSEDGGCVCVFVNTTSTNTHQVSAFLNKRADEPKTQIVETSCHMTGLSLTQPVSPAQMKSSFLLMCRLTPPTALLLSPQSS